MNTVMKAFRLPRKVVAAGDLGIEIEVEGRNLPVLEKFWRNEKDGSLRGAENMEYVFDKPRTLVEAREALDYLDEQYKLHNTTVDDTVRAGVHVHVNVQRLSIIELYNYMVTYLILEEVLVHYCGKDREGNLFCLRAGDADYLLNQLSYSARRKDFKNLVSDQLRYASMNVKALGTYGSLEFRAMRGTRDLDSIYKWAEVLLHLREYSKGFENPERIISLYSELGPEGFMQNALGKFTKLFACEGQESMILAGMRRAQDIAYCSNWEDFKVLATKLIGDLEFPVDVMFPNEPPEDY